MPPTLTHKQTPSLTHTQNHKAQLANAYNELGKELSSPKLRVVGNYTLGRVIGEGAYGKVRIGTHRLTSTRVAIKQIPKAMSTYLTREIHHHRQLHHPHITQMYEVIATESHIWIVTELCCGGELFDYLVEKGRLSEDETRVIFGQLCLAVDYLHTNNIVHRDLKLENVLLDEHCRVKLGDFGFTREFERGTLMETFCGTTGYASPEMLLAKKYQGPEVDVWSLGIILYCLLTGTLPFDDDDEDVMRSKIIKGEFEDPVWLSLESRDLIKNILVKDVATRYTIPQILAHPWFTSRKATYEPETPVSAMPLFSSVDRPATPEDDSRRSSQGTGPDSSQASTQDSTSPFIKQPDLVSSTPTTPDESMHDPFESTENNLSSNNEPSIHRLHSDSTIRKMSASDLDSVSSRLARTGDRQPATVIEEESEEPPRRHTPSPLIWNSKAPPPSHPVRTPARTKRRSVSSILSESASPTTEKTLIPLPMAASRDLDFQTLLSARTPVMFSTPPERHLLNTLASLGFDTAQIVHSVLSNACDASGSLWWMLRKKEEKAFLEKDLDSGAAVVASPSEIDESLPERPSGQGDTTPAPARQKTPKKKRNKVSAGVQTDAPDGQLVDTLQHHTAPKFALVPPTPTFSARPTTPPRAGSPSPRNPLLSPSSSTITGDMSSARSHPSTPSGSLKDSGTKGRKPRSGSVSIMQRATTALEAAGLVRKKSSEAVREEKERDRERSRDMERDKKSASGEEPRSSHGSGGSSKLTKSPPLKAAKDHVPPSTPPPHDGATGSGQIGSPWVLAEGREAVSQPNTLARAPPRGEILHSHSTPNFTEADPPVQAKPAGAGAGRNRANLLTAFRLWFNEDRKGKRKDSVDGSSSAPGVHARAPPPVGRRGSTSGGKFGTRGAPRTQRPSISSRRSSSVNSRRSSGTSVQMLVLDSPQLPARRSFGSHTPNSERGEHSSRPSSIRSVSMQPRHRKSPSQSSAGSVHLRTASPMQKYHRRGGSGSSTRVVRQIAPVARAPGAHARTNSAASSIHSQPSSRPTSWYEPSEGEGAPLRTSSPFKARTRRSVEDGPRKSGGSAAGSTTFVAQKRQGPFQSPGITAGRSSWKKSWGIEPPGWSTRTAHLPIEVLAISPALEPTSIRDVFSGKAAYAAAGDESDWVDEDEDIPAFAGGLGMPSWPLHGGAASLAHSSTYQVQAEPKPITLSPAPRGHRASSSSSKRGVRNAGASSGSSSSGGVGARQKAGSHSPAERASPLPSDTGYDSSESRPGRRQLPAARAGHPFKHAIQEEDEGEEE